VTHHTRSESVAVGFDVWARVVQRVRPQWSRDKLAILFDLLDGDDDAHLTPLELQRMPLLFNISLRPPRLDGSGNLFGRLMPRFYNSHFVSVFRVCHLCECSRATDRVCRGWCYTMRLRSSSTCWWCSTPRSFSSTGISTEKAN
jgi:hypothetical protein